MAIGYLTVFLLPAKNVQSNVAAFFMPWLTSLVILAITIAFNIEGTICWVMIFPIFALLAGIGGEIAYSRRKMTEGDARSKDDNDNNTIDTPDIFQVSIIAILPLLLGIAEGNRTQTRLDYLISREITISALREWMAELGKRAHVAVSHIGKWKTTAQMTAITVLLVQHPMLNYLGYFLLYVAVVLTIWSMIIYIRAAWPELSRVD